MSAQTVEPAAAAIAYIEAHLHEKLDLDRLAGGVRYSKYHLHRTFSAAVGMTPHSYIRRRQLTEAARLLVFSRQPILEIALAAGYDSQQAFTSVFKAMYKRTPLEYRRSQFFYPLQLKFALDGWPSAPGTALGRVTPASREDIPGWMRLTALVIGGFPCLDRTAHLARVREHIRLGQALVARDGDAVIGAAAYSRRSGSIHFLAVHPQYRRLELEQAFLRHMLGQLPPGRGLSITTFRPGDRADTGQRAEYMALGFAEAELLTEFGYPTQRLILPR